MKKFCLFLTLGMLFPTGLRAVEVDQKIWEGLLKTNVDTAGFVDYPGIRINRGGNLYEYLTLLEEVDSKVLSNSEKAAFWINAYNANVIKFILAKPTIAKVNEDLSFFDKKFKVARFNLSLNDIKNRLIRLDPPVSGLSLTEPDPYLLFLLNDGAVGSPTLSNHAVYTVGLTDKALASAAAFVNNPNNVRVENGTAVLSAFFQVHEKDFAKVGGVAVFILSQLNASLRPDAEEVKAALGAVDPSSFRYEYDWTVNNVKNKK